MGQDGVQKDQNVTITMRNAYSRLQIGIDTLIYIGSLSFNQIYTKELLEAKFTIPSESFLVRFIGLLRVILWPKNSFSKISKPSKPWLRVTAPTQTIIWYPFS